MKISIETIPHQLQRYPTVGDWSFETEQGKEILKINVSELRDERYEFLIALHEMIEAYLCRDSGITTEVVDEWDKSHPDDIDPGSHIECPYRSQHYIATVVERAIAHELRVSWDNYDLTIKAL